MTQPNEHEFTTDVESRLNAMTELQAEAKEMGLKINPEDLGNAIVRVMQYQKGDPADFKGVIVIDKAMKTNFRAFTR